MKFILRRNKHDSVMVEFYYTYNKHFQLACVMHEDCIMDSEVIRELDDTGQAEVIIKLAEDAAASKNSNITEERLRELAAKLAGIPDVTAEDLSALLGVIIKLAEA